MKDLIRIDCAYITLTFHVSSPLSGSTPKVNGFYSGLRPILHPSFMEISSVVFVDKPKQQQAKHNLYSECNLP